MAFPEYADQVKAQFPSQAEMRTDTKNWDPTWDDVNLHVFNMAAFFNKVFNRRESSYDASSSVNQPTSADQTFIDDTGEASTRSKGPKRKR